MCQSLSKLYRFFKRRKQKTLDVGVVILSAPQQEN